MPRNTRALQGRRRRRLARTLAAALLAAAATAASAAPAAARDLLRPAELRIDDYAETFTFVADLDDGTYVQLQLAVTNLGPGSGTGLCRVLVKRPSDAAWTRHERYGRSGWSYRTREDGEVLSIGGCAARSGAQTVVRAALGGRAVELTFPGPLSELAPPTVIAVRNREYRAWVLQAFTPVTARFEGFGVAAPQPGGGYADHSRTTVPAGALGRRWVRFRALRPPSRLLVLARQLPDGRWDPAWIWRQGEAPRPLASVELLRARGAGGAWSVVLRDGPATDTVSAGLRLYRHAPLEELGPMGWIAKAMMEVPVTTTYRATLAAPVPADGVLEVSILGKE
jgi:hypothetical protein